MLEEAKTTPQVVLVKPVIWKAKLLQGLQYQLEVRAEIAVFQSVKTESQPWRPGNSQLRLLIPLKEHAIIKSLTNCPVFQIFYSYRTRAKGGRFDKWHWEFWRIQVEAYRNRRKEPTTNQRSDRRRKTNCINSTYQSKCITQYILFVDQHWFLSSIT